MEIALQTWIIIVYVISIIEPDADQVEQNYKISNVNKG